MIEKTKGKKSGNDQTYACVVVTPLIKYVAGPLLGPAILKGAGELDGYNVSVLDLNLEYIRLSDHLKSWRQFEPFFYGDHSKPEWLNRVEDIFWREIYESFNGSVTLTSLKKGWYDHDALDKATDTLSHSKMGELLETITHRCPTSKLFGMSVMWSGQVVPAMLLSKIIKRNNSNVRVVWGGAHMTAIIDQIVSDGRFGDFIDGFLPGHCEGSFINLIESVKKGDFECPGLVIPGESPSGKPKTLVPPPNPVFEDLSVYGSPKLLLPFEVSKGCAYARCAFCTYPAVEGEYVTFPLDGLGRFVTYADNVGAGISFKDSLIPPAMLRSIAGIIKGRVEWSACTKLSPGLDEKLLTYISKTGCRTLEVGLESLNRVTQARIDKIQPPWLLDKFLNAEEHAGISVVLNYMTGFPWENPKESEKLLNHLSSYLRSFHGLTARIEHNTFNLEVLSPIARQPDRFDIAITGSWPWSSILDWRKLGQPMVSFPSPQNRISEQGNLSLSEEIGLR